jgi:hypothetical protein
VAHICTRARAAPVSYICLSNDKQCVLASSIADGGTLLLLEAATGALLNL